MHGTPHPSSRTKAIGLALAISLVLIALFAQKSGPSGVITMTLAFIPANGGITDSKTEQSEEFRATLQSWQYPNELAKKFIESPGFSEELRTYLETQSVEAQNPHLVAYLSTNPTGIRATTGGDTLLFLEFLNSDSLAGQADCKELSSFLNYKLKSLYQASSESAELQAKLEENSELLAELENRLLQTMTTNGQTSAISQQRLQLIRDALDKRASILSEKQNRRTALDFNAPRFVVIEARTSVPSPDWKSAPGWISGVLLLGAAYTASLYRSGTKGPKKSKPGNKAVNPLNGP